MDWIRGEGFEALPDFVGALAIGLLIGLERERHPGAQAGLRTFAIVALSGAAATLLAKQLAAPSIIAVGLAAIALMLVAASYRNGHDESDFGATTIAAAVACYLLAAMSLAGWPQLSMMLAVVVAVLLYFKAELGGFARALERRDLISILQFAVVTFIVLPLLPDVGMGPYQALNPRHVWWMVVLISGVSLAGYVALRTVGTRQAVLLGMLSGLVSSTATTLAYARHARGDAALLPLSVKVTLAANLTVVARIAVLAAVLAPAVLPSLLPALGLALLLGAAASASALRRRAIGDLEAPRVANPVEMHVALAFAALYAVVLMMSAWLTDQFGSRGIYATAAVSGLADVDAIALSSLRLAEQQALSPAQAATAVAVALCANVVFKLGIAGFIGGRALLSQIIPGMAAVIVGLAAGVALI